MLGHLNGFTEGDRAFGSTIEVPFRDVNFIFIYVLIYLFIYLFIHYLFI